MGCCSCKYLIEKKSEGKVNGNLYYCSKLKTYVNGANDKCDDYYFAQGRGGTVRDEIYNDGRKYYYDTTTIGLFS